MTGASLTVRVEDQAAIVALKRLIGVVSDRKPVMREIASALEASTTERFYDERDPDGAQWIPSERRRQGSPRPTLTLSSMLRDSITHRATADEAIVGTNKIYAATHQFGATIRPKKPGGRLAFAAADGAFVLAREVTIPARPFLGISAGDQAEIEAIIGRAVAAATRGASA